MNKNIEHFILDTHMFDSNLNITLKEQNQMLCNNIISKTNYYKTKYKTKPKIFISVYNHIIFNSNVFIFSPFNHSEYGMFYEFEVYVDLDDYLDDDEFILCDTMINYKQIKRKEKLLNIIKSHDSN